MSPTPLSRQNLQAISKSGVSVPAYGAGSLSHGIVHFGVGNFHRAHQAAYLSELFNLGFDHDWAIIGAGVRAADAEMRALLARQDWLSTVVERDADGQKASVTGAMIDYIEPGDSAGLMAVLVDPRTRIVSLTITEGGYFLNAETGAFDPAHPDISADGRNPADPKTVFGFILAALRARKDAGVPAFTVMSCDNIPGNGHVALDAVAGLAELSDPGFAGWIRESVAFPNGMVDRITPATSDVERALVRDEFGIEDAWPVTCESFRQWVVEDHFPTGRPRLEEVGVTFVDDVEPFELMKLRILNGGHAAIAYPAGLMDIHFVHEAMQDPLIAAWLEKLERTEVLSEVPPVPGTSLDAYLETVMGRFANPRVQDTIRRLCFDGSNRQPKFILPTATSRLARGEAVEGLALASAFWCRYCAGTTDSGATIAPNDPMWDELQTRALAAREDPMAFLGLTTVFGNLANDPAYVQSFTHALQTIWSLGARGTLERYLAG